MAGTWTDFAAAAAFGAGIAALAPANAFGCAPPGASERRIAARCPLAFCEAGGAALSGAGAVAVPSGRAG